MDSKYSSMSRESSTEDSQSLSGTATPKETSAIWFAIPQDADLVEHLLNLYFCWVHPFYQLFSRDHFIHNMGRGGTGFCSAMLVNALLANACHYSDRPSARGDPRNPSTAGDQFFAEAKRLLDKTERPSLTTVQALGLMSIREASQGRDSNAYQYVGRSVRMALELGLHLSMIGSGMRPAEIEVRKITFWGVFNLETFVHSLSVGCYPGKLTSDGSVCSVGVGRLSQLPRTAADIQKPAVIGMSERSPLFPLY